MTDQLDSLETTVARMARIGSCTSPSFSPDGKQLAFASSLNGLPQVWTVATEGGWPRLVTALDDRVGTVLWSPDGEWLAFSLAPGGGMNVQIYLIRPDGTGLRCLTDGGKENNWIGDWTHDGRALVLASNRRSADAMDVYFADVGGIGDVADVGGNAEGALRLATENDGVGVYTDLSHDGRRAVLYRMVDRTNNNLHLVDIDSQETWLLTPHEGPGTFNNGLFSPDGDTIYISSDQGSELAYLARVKLDADGRPGPIERLVERSDAELEVLDVSEDGRRAALLWNVAGRSELSFLDLGTLEPTPGPDLPMDIVFEMTFSKDGSRLALAGSGATSPRNIWVFDCEARRLWQVTHSHHPGVDLTALVRPELVHFTAHDGLELSGWLYRPPGHSAPDPLVISFHGGPESQEQPYFNSTYQALLTQGIAVFAPNVRGSTGFGKTFANLDNGPLRVNAVRDVKSCVDYVVGAGVANPKKIGIMGGSYGGYLTMAGLTEYPELFAAGANSYGIVNFETFFAHTEPWMAAVSKVEYGDPDTEANLLRSLSPIHKIDRVIAPTIVLHGANDTNVPVVEAEQVVESLKQRNVPVEYVLFPDEGHGFAKETNRIRATVAIVRWFAEHLRR